MARYFLDSSALIKRYHWESGSSEVERLFADPGHHHFVSRLALVELHSAFARLVREGVLSEPDLRRVMSRVMGDVASATLTVAAIGGVHLDRVTTLLTTYGLSRGLRTLDALHLATALALHERSPLAGFVAADRHLLAAAVAHGIAVLDVSRP